MQFEVSFATYGIQKTGEKQGFQLYSSIGFIDEFDLSDRFKLFQIPSEIILMQNESLYSIFLLSTDEYDILFLNHYWYTGESVGFRNCYDGFSMIFKYKLSLPNIISIAEEYVKHTRKVKGGQLNFELLLKSSFEILNPFELDPDNTSRSKKKVIEFHSSENIKHIILDVIESALGRNSNRRYVYFTQSISLFNRVNSISLDKTNVATLGQAESNNYIYQIETKYNALLSEMDASIKNSKGYLSKLQNDIKNAEKTYEVLFNKCAEKNKQLVSIQDKYNTKVKEIKKFEQKIKILKKSIKLFFQIKKRILLICGGLLVIISSIVVLLFVSFLS